MLLSVILYCRLQSTTAAVQFRLQLSSSHFDKGRNKRGKGRNKRGKGRNRPPDTKTSFFVQIWGGDEKPKI
jgi:hypothetical protein